MADTGARRTASTSVRSATTSMPSWSTVTSALLRAESTQSLCRPSTALRTHASHTARCSSLAAYCAGSVLVGYHLRHGLPGAQSCSRHRLHLNQHPQPALPPIPQPGGAAQQSLPPAALESQQLTACGSWCIQALGEKFEDDVFIPTNEPSGSIFCTVTR